MADGQKNIWIIRTILFIFAASILGFLFYQNIVPGGELNLAHDFQSASPFISPIYPEGRTAKEKDGISIFEEPAYFDARVPRKFEKVKVKVYYDNLAPPILELGAERSPGKKNFTFRPLQNKTLDDLNWKKISDGNLVLYERNGGFEEIGDFLRRMPSKDSIALYRAPLQYNYKIPDYVPWGGERRIDANLSGSFKFFTYIKNEPLNFRFVFGAEEGFLPITIRVWSGERLVSEREFVPLDGLAEKLKTRREFRIINYDLPEGAYGIEVSADKSVTTEKIFGNPHFITFASPLVFKKFAGATAFLTSSRRLGVKSLGDQAVSIRVGGREHQLEEKDKRYEIDLGDSPYLLNLVYFYGGEIEIEGDGLFAFAWNNFFNPFIGTLLPGVAPSENINYILTSYQGAKDENGVTVSEAEFHMQNVEVSKNRKMRFVISLPGLKSGEPGVRIKKVEIEFTGEKAGWEWVWEKIKKVFMDITL